MKPLRSVYHTCFVHAKAQAIPGHEAKVAGTRGFSVKNAGDELRQVRIGPTVLELVIGNIVTETTEAIVNPAQSISGGDRQT